MYEACNMNWTQLHPPTAQVSHIAYLEWIKAKIYDMCLNMEVVRSVLQAKKLFPSGGEEGKFIGRRTSCLEI